MNPGSGMKPDKYQQAWQAHTAEARVTVNTDALLKAVQTNQAAERAVNALGDYVEIGSALLFIVVWFYMGAKIPGPWTWYLMVPVFIWSIVLTLVVRAGQRRQPKESGEPLLVSAKESLALVDHRIWWSRRHFWWASVPAAIAMLIFFINVGWSSMRPADNWRDTLGQVGLFLAVSMLSFFIVFSVYGSTYFLNRRTLRAVYEPERRELLALLAALSDDGMSRETPSEVRGEYPVLTGKTRRKMSGRRALFTLLWVTVCLVVTLAICFRLITFLTDLSSSLDHAERSPFAAVRWQESQPEVEVNDEWFQLVSLDGVPVSEIVAYSQRTYRKIWQKRFEEDLVAVLTGMGHVPKDTVRLVVMRLGSKETLTLDEVPMTWANRKAIWDAADARERGKRE